MKDFVKTVLAVICGYIVLKLIGLIFMLILFGSAAASGAGSLPKSGVLDLDLSGFNIAEQTQDGPMPSSASLLSGSMEIVPVIGLRDAVEALKAAADDPGIPYVLLRADGMTAGTGDDAKWPVLRVMMASQFSAIAEAATTASSKSSISLVRAVPN